jgi:hypothetical protein
MELNALSLFIPGDTVHTTIQSAVNAAHQAPGGAVWITASYTGHDTYTNPNSVPVFDMRGTGSTSFAGGGTPAGSNTQIQFNDSSAFGADSELTWDPVTHQAFAGLPSSSFTAPVQNALLTAATITATAKHTALDSANAKAAAVFATQNDKDNPGYGLGMVVTATGTGNGDISGQESDVIAVPAMGKTINLAQSLYAYAEADGPGGVVNLSGAYALVGTVGGSTTSQIGFWADGAFRSDPGTVANNFGFYSGNQGAVGSAFNAAYYASSQGSFGATKDYLVWFDTPNGNAVYRIKNDGVMGYYNPSFSPKYTPGSQDFERVVIQWTSDVCEIGTQNGTNSGVLRPLRLLGSNVIIPGSTPASAGAAGVAGTVTWDASFIYVCTATNTWKRVAIATW